MGLSNFRRHRLARRSVLRAYSKDPAIRDLVDHPNIEDGGVVVHGGENEAGAMRAKRQAEGRASAVPRSHVKKAGGRQKRSHFY